MPGEAAVAGTPDGHGRGRADAGRGAGDGGDPRVGLRRVRGLDERADPGAAAGARGGGVGYLVGWLSGWRVSASCVELEFMGWWLGWGAVLSGGGGVCVCV